ncbi:MAG: hypothetical protein Q9188_005034 [Gyalolechia gomerana]
MESRSDNFKWFGEGFDGFPKILPDDCVQYALYIIDANLSDFDVRQQLRTIQTAANALCKTLLNEFIWQRDSFDLELVQQDGRSFLQGQTNFGDSVEDEWLVVYLLRELSRKFRHSWIRVFDSDGEFLLIEAADALPKWLNPDVAENRVWINDGKLLIIPKLPKPKKARPEALNLDNASTFIQDRKDNLLHSPTIDSEAFYRLQKYPAQIKASLHHAMITIPRKLAYVLHEDAAYISPAVEAFYLRDPISLRSLQSHQPSTLFFDPKDFVTVSVKFTKVGYAQLKGQDFQTPPAWAAYFPRDPETRIHPGSEMGMKVTCGFEMLLSDPQNVDKKPVREMKLLLEDLDAGEERLPSDDEILKWDRIQDDESWLDIDFSDFDKELSGRATLDQLGQGTGFGDKTAHENLRKMVARFEKFVNEDDGAAEDADFLDDTDNDDTSNSSGKTGSDSSGGEEVDKEVEFDEDRFASMMRDMMGLPAATTPDNAQRPESKVDSGLPVQGGNGSIDEEKEIRGVMDEIEDELRQAGALSLDPLSEEKVAIQEVLSPSTAAARASSATTVSNSPRSSEASPDEGCSAGDAELNVDLDRVRELLRGFSVTS